MNSFCNVFFQQNKDPWLESLCQPSLGLASLVFTPAAVSLAPCLDAHTGKTPGTDLFVIAVFITTNQLKTPRARILKAIKDDKK
jgi:hypothetical protein